MSSLPDPIREALDASPTEGEVASVWRGVRARRERKRRGRPVVWAAAAAVVVALSVLLVVVTRPSPSAGSPATPPPAGPLERVNAGQAVLDVLSGGVEIEAEAALSDGSRITPREGARLAVLENTGSRFVTLLGAGRAGFSVKPGGPRRWVVECGLATIEVVGTAFELERARGALRVEVKEGVVLVRGEHVPDRVRRLAAGESLEILDPKARAQVLAERQPEAPEPGPGGVEARPTPASDPVGALDAAADRARRAGNASEAARVLEEGLAKEPSGHRAALRAFTLGRLYLDELGQATRGARAFERALSAGPPSSLEEDVRARLVEARARMADSAGARQAAEGYRARFPGGRRRAEVDRWSPVE